jgi:septum formation protein
VSDAIGDGSVLGGDTLVAALDGRVFGKPVDRDDARRIISALAGTKHEVITGVTLVDVQRRIRMIHHAVTLVTMKPLAEAEIETYLDSDEWVGKAGAYGIQDYVVGIDGSFTNVVGFPMELITEMLGRFEDSVRSSKSGRHVAAHW